MQIFFLKPEKPFLSSLELFSGSGEVLPLFSTRAKLSSVLL
jgi:hypothetical protein